MKSNKIAFLLLLPLVLFLALYFYRETTTIFYDKKISQFKCPNCNVILIGVDTLRADHLGSYGYNRATSPNIDKLAQRGILFKNTFSASSKTTPSFMSMFTSLYPFDHGVTSNITLDRPQDIMRINNKVITLAEILKANNYLTTAMITSGQIPEEVGFKDGFDDYQKGAYVKKRQDLLDWLNANYDKKFFIFFHDIGPHDPYVPPEPYDTLFNPNYKGKISLKGLSRENFEIHNEDTIEDSLQKLAIRRGTYSEDFWENVDTKNADDINQLKALYDGEIKHLDDFIGELQNVLTEKGLWQKTIIIFTSDHGEEFGEHGKFRHDQLYNELIHVPLIFSLPNIQSPLVIDQRARTIDIMPTIVDILTLNASLKIRGQSLLPLILSPRQVWYPQAAATQFEDRDKTIISQDYKLIVQNNKRELYNLKSDFAEKNNLISSRPEVAQDLENQLLSLLDSKEYKYTATPLKLNIDKKTLDNLKELGYGNP